MAWPTRTVVAQFAQTDEAAAYRFVVVAKERQRHQAARAQRAVGGQGADEGVGSVRRHPVFLRFVRGVDLDEDVKAAPFLLQAAVEVGEITRKPVGGNGAAVDRVVVWGVGEKDGWHGSGTQAVRGECRQGSVVADSAIDDL